MNFQALLRHPLFQYSLEILLPLIGFLFFNWSLPVIIAFYFFDYLGSEITRQRRHHKVLQVKAPDAKSKYVFGLIFSVTCFLIALLTVYFVFLDLELNLNYEPSPGADILSFLKDEGWFLLPIVVLANIMKDKVSYYMPKKYLNYSFQKLIKSFYIESIVMLILIIIGLFAYGALAVRQVHGIFMLCAFVAIKLMFDFVLVKNLNEKAKI